MELRFEPKFYREHLGEKSDHKSLIQDFQPTRPEDYGLTRYLQDQAFVDEESGNIRTYLIRQKGTGELVGYHSIRAGNILLRQNESTTKTGDQAGGQKLTYLENAILQSVRYADIQDFPKDFGIQTPMIAHDDLVTFLKQHYDQHRRRYSGKKRGQRRSCSTDSNTVDQNGISHYVHQIRYQ